jgi:hypothetical protein
MAARTLPSTEVVIDLELRRRIDEYLTTDDG